MSTQVRLQSSQAIRIGEALAWSLSLRKPPPCSTHDEDAGRTDG
jgi:hypothetical protein